MALSVSACGSDDEKDANASSGGGAGTTAAAESAGGDQVSTAQATVDKMSVAPKEIVQPGVGLKEFTPKPGAKIFNIACSQAIVGCKQNAGFVKKASERLGMSTSCVTPGRIRKVPTSASKTPSTRSLM
jgi:hypothetical protein